jgi:uncharacterized protein
MINTGQLITNLLSVLVFFALLFGFTKLLGPIPFDVNSITTTKSESFSVTGEGRVDAKPDSATVRLGVVSKAPTSEGAQNLLNTNINKVITAVKQLGVPAENIKTENYNIYPEYNQTITLRDGDKNNISGYTANTNISITVDTAELANKVIDAGTSNGANQVGGVDFQVKDKTAALNEAREEAVADAKKKAEDASRIAGFKLGRIINYSEGGGGGYPVPMYAKAEDARAGGAPTQVEPGTNEIVISVTLSYEIR